MRGTDGDGAGAEAVAAVVCDLISAGNFLVNAIPAGAEAVKFCLEVCLRARVALLAGFVRSIFEATTGETRREEGWRRIEGKRRLKYGCSVLQ